MNQEQLRIVCGLKNLLESSNEEKDPKIAALQKDLYKKGLEAATNLFETYGSGLLRASDSIFIQKSTWCSGASIINKPNNQAHESAKQEIEALGNIMGKISANEIPSDALIKALKWDTSYWKRFIIALKKLVTALKNKIYPRLTFKQTLMFKNLDITDAKASFTMPPRN